MVLRRTKPLTPKVEGMRSAKVCQYQGIAVPGQLTPLRKSIGTEVKTAMSMMLSRPLGMPLMAMAKNTQAKRKGTAKSAMSTACPICGNENKWGTTPISKAATGM